MDALPEPIAPQPFRRYPTTRRMQRRVLSDADACQHCVAGVCCASEDPIALTAFDVLRLSAFLDLSPGEFLRRFTQDRFAVDDNPVAREEALRHPESSVVTWLRRRSNSVFSPCVFLKLIHGADGTPRRVCSIHPARPLACREYYFNTCKTRWTGELAALTAHAHEGARDGLITAEQAERGFRAAREEVRAQPDSAVALLRRFYWSEARRALNPEACNHEGAARYPVADWQDPLPDKLNRLLSRKNLRLEERYGPEPWGDQLQPYAAGDAFASSPERERLLCLTETEPQTDFFADGDYPLRVADREWFPGALPARGFALLNEPALARATAGMNPESARIARALLNGVNFIARCAGKIDAMGSLLELEPDGVLEAWILAGCRRLRRNSATAGGSHPALDPLIEWSRFRARRGGAVREALRALSALRSLSRRETRRVLEAQQWNGAWGPDPGRMRALPAAQGDYLKSRLWQTLCRLEQLNRSLETTPGA